MSPEENDFPDPFSPVNCLREYEEESEDETKDETRDELMLASEKWDHHQTMKDIEHNHMWHDATSLPNDPWAPTPLQIMRDTYDSDMEFGAAGLTANLKEQGNDCNDHEKSIFFYQEHFFADIDGKTPTDQPRSFPAASSPSNAICQQELVASSRDSVVTPNFQHWLELADCLEEHLEEQATHETSLCAPTCATIGPIQVEASTSSTAAPEQAALKPHKTPLEAAQVDTTHSAEFGNIDSNSVRVSTEKEANGWLSKFKQCVLSRQTKKDKRGRNLRVWLRGQQKLHSQGKLNPRRQSLLSQYGMLDPSRPKPFVETAEQKAKWMRQYKKLKQYRLDNGHNGVSIHEDKSLYHWIKTQREKYHDWKRGTFIMPFYRVEKLEQIGFQWKTSKVSKSPT